MFTPKTFRSLTLAILLSAPAMAGCEKSLDSPEYGERIYEIPPELDKPFPLPELNPPSDSPLPGPDDAKTEAEKSPE
jgi:hypothetical protein